MADVGRPEVENARKSEPPMPTTIWRRTPAWFRNSLGVLLLAAVWEWMVKPTGEYLFNQSPNMWTAIKNFPVSRAALIEGRVQTSGDPSLVVVLLVLFLAIAATLLRRYHRATSEREQRKVYLSWLIYVLVFVAVTFAGLYVTQLSTNLVYEFRVNMTRAGPQLTMDEERRLRADFSLMKTRADFEAIRKRLRDKLQAAYFEP